MATTLRWFGAVGLTVALLASGCADSDDDASRGEENSPTTASADGSDDIAPTIQPATFAERPCWEEVIATPPVSVRCGEVTVPERHADSGGGVVVLPVAILEPPVEKSATPVVYLDGGPGGDGVTSAEAFSEDAFAQDRTIVIVGQRGTPFASPSFDCPEVEETNASLLDDALAEPAADDAADAALRSCFDRVTAGDPDLSTYDSATAADDLEATRQALGYEQWSLYGISYGTRLALEVLRRHPEHVEAAVLDSSYPSEVDAYATLVPGAARAFGELFAACEADPACAGAYPNLEARTEALYEQFETEPIDATTVDPATGATVAVRWDGDRLMQAAFNALYLPELIPVLPSLVAAAENGDLALATAAYVQLISQAAEASAEGLYYAVECRERYPFSDLDAVAIQQQEEPAYLVAAAAAETEAEGCLVWEAPPADESVTEPITSSVPVLVLAGRFDPITPPEWGRQLADAQPTAYYVEFPHIGHGATGDSCANEIAAAFLTDPATQPDTSCVDTIAPIAWVLP